MFSTTHQITTENQVKLALEKAKEICKKSIFQIENKYDPKHFYQIESDLREFEALLEKKGIIEASNYFFKTLLSNSWQNDNWNNDYGNMIDKLNRAGTTPLMALNTDIRVRRIPKKILINYQHVFFYIWKAKELLNIKPDPKSKEKGGSDFRYPNFGYVYSEGEKWGSYLRTKF